MAIIDKLRGVDILSPQLGEEPARETVEWLQDEMEPLAGGDKLDQMWSRIDARFDRTDARFERIDARFEQMDARFAQMLAQMEVRMWRMGVAILAILLTALGIATALIITLN